MAIKMSAMRDRMDDTKTGPMLNKPRMLPVSARPHTLRWIDMTPPKRAKTEKTIPMMPHTRKIAPKPPKNGSPRRGAEMKLEYTQEMMPRMPATMSRAPAAIGIAVFCGGAWKAG